MNGQSHANVLTSGGVFLACLVFCLVVFPVVSIVLNIIVGDTPFVWLFILAAGTMIWPQGLETVNATDYEIYDSAAVRLIPIAFWLLTLLVFAVVARNLRNWQRDFAGLTTIVAGTLLIHLVLICCGFRALMVFP